MDIKRVYEILNNKEKVNIEYDLRPVWIQYLQNSNEAKVGFIDNFEEQVVDIENLNEVKI